MRLGQLRQGPYVLCLFGPRHCDLLPGGPGASFPPRTADMFELRAQRLALHRLGLCGDLFPLGALGVHRPAYPRVVAVDTDPGVIVKIAVAPYPLAYMRAQLSGHVPALAYLYTALDDGPHAAPGNRLVEHIEHPLVFDAPHGALP